MANEIFAFVSAEGSGSSEKAEAGLRATWLFIPASEDHISLTWKPKERGRIATLEILADAFGIALPN